MDVISTFVEAVLWIAGIAVGGTIGELLGLWDFPLILS